MKYTNLLYAQALAQSPDTTKDNKQVAKNFWYVLQKNKQYRNLRKILDNLDEISATQEGKKLVKVYTNKELDDVTRQEILEVLNNKIKSPLKIVEIIDKNVFGVILKYDDKILDLSISGKINRFKQAILQ